MKEYDVLNNYKMRINVTENVYDFQLEQLFKMALRINKNRSFLFVSEVLGKHLAVPPQIPILTSHLLVHRFLSNEPLATTASLVQAIKTKENLQQTLQLLRETPYTFERPLRVIGFAETATALGHGFFENFRGDVQYVHTTREHLVGIEPIITFEEEHSHASTHRLYGDPTFFVEDAHYVLVDDEMTTGKTNLNIIEQLHNRFPFMRDFTLISILDWRSDEHLAQMQQLAEQLKISIHSVSILSGQIEMMTLSTEFQEQNKVLVEENGKTTYVSFQQQLTPYCQTYYSQNSEGYVYTANYLQHSGRFALTAKKHLLDNTLQSIAMQMQESRTGSRCLVIGTGEFMYIPLEIATRLGEGVSFHATTRSPIFAHPQSIIYDKLQFPSAEFPHVENYLYNVPSNVYDDIFVVFERIIDEQALAQLISQLQKRCQNVVIFTLGGGVFDQAKTG